MESLMELLPLMIDEYGQPVGWKYNTDVLMNKTLQPRDSHHLGPFNFGGWIRSTGVVFNTPYAEITHTVWTKEVTFTPYFLFLIGLWRYGGTCQSPSLDQYNPAANLYTIGYQPVPPQDFLKGTDIWIRNPLTTSITYSLFWNIVLIYDRIKFINKMNEVIGTDARKLGVRIPEIPEIPTPGIGRRIR